jgi:hypothetical protein
MVTTVPLAMKIRLSLNGDELQDAPEPSSTMRSPPTMDCIPKTTAYLGVDPSTYPHDPVSPEKVLTVPSSNEVRLI